VESSYRTFRPRAARVVPTVLAAVVLIGTGLLLVLMPSLSLVDQAGFVLVALLIVWFCWRQATVQARVDADGVTVRNLIYTRRLEWAEIVSVRFGSGRAWVQLDLADGDTLAVMGIQRADGAYADAEARRLSTLVAQHTATPRDD